jgi:hypothetical protein
MSEEVASGQRELLSDDEVHRRMMASPAVQARLAEVLAELRDPNRKRARGLTTEVLVEFLREHG